MSDGIKLCDCGCMYDSPECPYCNRVTDKDRIKQLEAELEYWRKDSADAWDKCEENREKLSKSEALLAKAVRLLELSVELATWNTTLLEDVIDFIAELKGQNDE